MLWFQVFSDISAIAFLKMSIYIMKLSSFQPLRFIMFVGFIWKRSFTCQHRLVNKSIQLDISGDNDLNILLKNYQCFVIKTYNNIKLDGLGVQLVNNSIQLHVSGNNDVILLLKNY